VGDSSGPTDGLGPARALAGEVLRRRIVRRNVGMAAFATGAAVHGLAYKADWRDALGELLPWTPLAAATATAAALTLAAVWLSRRRALSHPTADANALAARARDAERASILWPLWGAATLGPLLLALPTAGADFDRLVTGVWTTAIATHAALLLVSWTTAERLSRATDRTLEDPLAASGAITWVAVAVAVVLLGRALGRPVLVLGLGLAAFAGLSYLACARLAIERAALRDRGASNVSSPPHD